MNHTDAQGFGRILNRSYQEMHDSPTTAYRSDRELSGASQDCNVVLHVEFQLQFPKGSRKGSTDVPMDTADTPGYRMC